MISRVRAPARGTPGRLVPHLDHTGAPEGIVLVVAGEDEDLPDRAPDVNARGDPQILTGLPRIDGGPPRDGSVVLLSR